MINYDDIRLGLRIWCPTNGWGNVLEFELNNENTPMLIDFDNNGFQERLAKDIFLTNE